MQRSSRKSISIPSFYSLILILITLSVDLNECEAMKEFCHHGQCENIPGSFRCICDKGFQLNRYNNNCTGKLNLSFSFCSNAPSPPPPPPPHPPSLASHTSYTQKKNEQLVAIVLRTTGLNNVLLPTFVNNNV